MQIKSGMVSIVLISLLLLHISIAQNETESPPENSTQGNEGTIIEQNETKTLPSNESTPINETSECGNNLCENNESISCPEDCDVCLANEECNDNDYCTLDTCEGIPKKCSYVPRICDDNNPSTINSCSEGSCKYEPITTCASGDNYCPSGCNHNLDSDCKSEPLPNKCSKSDDCEDNNPCTEDSCEGEPKACNYNRQNGCQLGDKCLDYGAKEEINGVNSYCGRSNNWEQQKVDKTLCKDDYECISNKCSDGICIKPAREPSTIEKVLNWLATLIGALFGIFK